MKDGKVNVVDDLDHWLAAYAEDKPHIVRSRRARSGQHVPIASL